MALHPAPDANGAQRPSLRLLRDRKPDRRSARDEATVELIAFMDEVILAMHDIHDAEVSRDIPSARVINEAGRIAHKAIAARAEYFALVGPEVA